MADFGSLGWIRSCGILFVVLRDAVKVYPAHNGRFVEFIVELQDISFPGGTFKDQMYKMGQDLTEFEFGQIETSPFDSNIIPERQGYINLCAFIAKLHNRGICTADKISDLSRGAQVLTEALEEAPWEKHHHEDIEAYLKTTRTRISTRKSAMNYLLRTLGFWIGGFRVLHSWFLYVGGRFMGSWGWRILGRRVGGRFGRRRGGRGDGGGFGG
ncbi:uncharacterized protein ASPGLDRAFT_80553 [Aspergillus glaucus CBS 516.65]|uniref:Uncharacterized protein n=1 Tax=Aspergillus glaucus CBS 516.65 TaxID=1160497 RepID=A0A1L9VRP7_ASPGL|nr:hypothetical protein ASPGLDRAFT_80553 [Aspergillus glaucus CBS 516.65]OJJ86593.1 hypothetical protein ASPGLDRAFT_80553 [Aspergillus glaucus CBS 516.65]